jgi:hypothetical protein
VNRNPPVDLRRTLRQEVRFGCPIPNCGSPYLVYHHFDPPWHEQQHMIPEGIIPLCAQHHAWADQGTWTTSQLREFKQSASHRRASVRGRSAWMRERVLGEVGGNFVYDCSVMLSCVGREVIWFTRNQAGYLEVNLRMPRTPTEFDLVMENNDWTVDVSEAIKDIDCAPSGHRLRIVYTNGDSLTLQFREVPSAVNLAPKNPDQRALFSATALRMLNSLAFPLLCVDFGMIIQALVLQ